MTPSNKLEPEEECQAISETLARIGDKWTVLVVELLAVRTMRFNEIRHTIGNISQRMLTTGSRSQSERAGMRDLAITAGPRRGPRRWLGFAIPAASNSFRASTMAG